MKQLTAMLERTADGAMVVDQEGKIMLWNRAAEHVLGFRAADVRGCFCHDVLCGDTLSGRPLCSQRAVRSVPVSRKATASVNSTCRPMPRTGVWCGSTSVRCLCLPASPTPSGSRTSFGISRNTSRFPVDSGTACRRVRFRCTSRSLVGFAAGHSRGASTQPTGTGDSSPAGDR